MKDLDTISHFPHMENLVQVLMQKTQNNNPLFFRILVTYYFGKLASMMRTDIQTHERGTIPVSVYAMNLAASGHGKGHSTNIIEEQVINKFRVNFLESTFMEVSEKSLADLAIKRSIKHDDGEFEEQWMDKVHKEFELLGQLAFSFDSATPAAVKQMRHKLLMAGAGSINFEMDEIGSNLMGNVDVLATFLELYDVGKVKQKLTKNTAENKRSEEMDGRTPTNMMLFGTPSKLLDGGKVEAEFMTMLETGYARRCLFGFNSKLVKRDVLTPDQIYDMMTDPASEKFLIAFSKKLGNLANIINFNKTLIMDKKVTLILIEYKTKCEGIAEEFKDHQEILRAEVSHRYYKALKVAGAFAFIDGSHDISEDHIYQAIKLVEESGVAFSQILTRERHYVKLAKYIASVEKEVTQVDLVEDLPFYRGGESQKRDLMSLAIAYGYKNNIIIKITMDNQIEFFKGESMEVTNLDNMIVSYSTDLVNSYKGERVPFDKLHKVVRANGYNYCAHHFSEEYRDSKHIIKGFNMIILDIDKDISLSTAKLLLKDYTALYATTKRHTEQSNRFRIILPLSHTVKLTKENYAKFMKNVYNWLPFTNDEATFDIARKWSSFGGSSDYQEGELIDAMLFIPQTRKEEHQSKRIYNTQSLPNLERWFLLHTENGNRSNTLLKFGYTLVDNGYSLEQIRSKILSFNEKLPESLDETEINTTILITIAKAIGKHESK